MAIKLKNCPFCGSPPQQPEDITPGKRPSWKIICHSYCASMIRGSRKEVVADWNQRVNTED